MHVGRHRSWITGIALPFISSSWLSDLVSVVRLSTTAPRLDVIGGRRGTPCHYYYPRIEIWHGRDCGFSPRRLKSTCFRMKCLDTFLTLQVESGCKRLQASASGCKQLLDFAGNRIGVARRKNPCFALLIRWSPVRIWHGLPRVQVDGRSQSRFALWGVSSVGRAADS